MATVINNPSDGNSNSGMGFLIGILVLIAFVFILIYYGLPALRNTTGGTAPSSPSSEVIIDVPEQVDVNINQGEE